LREAERSGGLSDRNDWGTALSKGIINDEDHRQLTAARAAMRKAIEVDDFPADAFARRH
jgi:hypothetical protein